MAPVAGRPFLELILSNLANQGFERVILAVGYMADRILSHFGEEYRGMKLLYEIESVPLGTGGALRKAMARCDFDHAFVLNGDTYLDFQAVTLEAKWQLHRHPLIIACEVPDTTRYGRLTATDGRVLGFSEKGASGPGLINAGCYLLPTNIFAGYDKPDPFSLETDFLAHEIATRKYELYVSRGKFIDIGIPADYARAQVELSGRP